MNFKTGYKQTEIGVIPEDWKVLQLGEIGKFSKGSGIKKDDSQSGEIACVRYGEIYTKHNHVVKNYHSFISQGVAKGAKKLKTGDILFAGSGETKEEIGKSVAVVDDIDVYAGGDIVVFSPLNTDSVFLGYLLDTPLARLQKSSKGQGDAVVHISSSSLSTIKLPFPPLPEQTAIAAALSDVDALMGELDKLIAKKRDIKQATMQQLLTGKKRLAGFSGEWEVKTFGELFDYLPTATNSRADLSESGDVYYVHYGDIHTRFHNHLDFQHTQPSKIERLKCKNAAFLKNGDWVMADASEDFDGVGKSIEILGLNENTKAVAGLHTFLLREKRPLFAPMFKGHLGNLKSLHEQFLRVATGMKVFGVSKTALKDLVLTIPSIEEQTAIATILSDMDTEINALQQKREKTAQLKQGMMQELLTGRIRLPIEG